MSHVESQAIKDIKKFLEDEGKMFIPYRKYLDPIMRLLTNQYIEQQKKLKSN